MGIARWRKKLQKYRRLESSDRRLILRAVGWLAYARVLLSIVPFRQLSERLMHGQETLTAEPDLTYLEQVAYAIRATANNVPWRSDCFPQTIAARMILKRKGYASIIHIGVERVGDDELAGHAWLTCGDFVVTGDGGLERYTELHRYGD